ncbi:site-specific integrase [Vagococcus bubulae]|uniref:site-specific integrase n=1 Tax=Vagococcus bubulae TaxID=1977868 RepID=UPI001FB2832C|nr:site-specific integrase [Vagococcus bubulae]
MQFFHCLEQLNDKRAFTFFRVLAFLGLRKGEAMALTWKDFNFDDNTVTINKTLVELQDGSYEINTTKTESSNRTISIDQQTISILKDWRSHIKRLKLSQGIRDKDFASSLVFSNSVLYRYNQYLSKAYPNNVLVEVKKHFPEMKIIKVHDFRKTNASLLFESGASIKDVAQRLGHQSTKTTTDIYVKVTPAKQNQTIDIFEKYMAL